MMMNAAQCASSLSFRNALPRDRLGQEHASLESFRQAVNNSDDHTANDDNTIVQRRRRRRRTMQKEYSLVVVIEPQTQRILLGKKHRGFGAGFYNSFGGKLEMGETDAQSAVRELEEETGINLLSMSSSSSLFDMAQHKVGTMHFTFDDSETEMVVHVFCIHVSCHGNDKDNSNNVVDTTSYSGIETIPLDPTVIRGCDEISPLWFDNWYDDIPLHNMFADDSIWLTRLLSHHHHHHHHHHHQDGSYNDADNTSNSSCSGRFTMNGWFHFAAGGQEENRILHYYLNVKTHYRYINCNNEATVSSNINASSSSRSSSSSNNKSRDDNNIASSLEQQHPFSLEKRLFHTLHDNQIRSPTIKEFKESWAFCNAVRIFVLDKQANHDDEDSSSSSSLDLVIDVAAGHGALAALFLILTSARRAIVIDPAQVGGGGVVRAWSEFFNKKDSNHSMKTLEYRHECLLTGLPAVLKTAIIDNGIDPRRILVVACHACQHLSDEVLAIACGRFGVHAAVMPCCQKDSNGGYWKSVAKKMNVPIAIVMDILLAGKAATWPVRDGQQGYDVRIKVLDQSITPQNRLILCRAIGNSPVNNSAIMLPNDNISRNATVDKAQEKLERAYRRAHDNIQPRKGDEKTGGGGFAASLTIVAATNAMNDLLTLVIQQKQQVSLLLTGFCMGLLVAQTLVTARPDRAG
jgi:8-oxo-dGTP pyrophosphatase MutT (NUDIX family)